RAFDDLALRSKPTGIGPRTQWEMPTPRPGAIDRPHPPAPKANGECEQPETPPPIPAGRKVEGLIKKAARLIGRLIDKQMEILDLLFSRQAFSPSRMIRMQDIATTCNANEGTMRRAAGVLVKLKLARSKLGSGGGYWLTELGKITVALLR